MMEVASLEGDRGGRNALFGDPKTVHLSLSAGESVPEHRHPDASIVFAVVDGEVVLTVGDEEATLGGGDLARFDGDDAIAVEAREATDALVFFGED